MKQFSHLYIGADHGGFVAKQTVSEWLKTEGYDVTDLGAETLNPEDDYPQFAFAVARAVVERPGSAGILFCRSGAGMTIAANKVDGARAVAVAQDNEAVHARANNDANIIALSGDWLDIERMQQILKLFLETPGPTEDRHLRRLAQIEENSRS